MTNHKKYFFIVIMTILLIMACAPAMVTPIPPLNPNEVGTVIARTANAANALTQASLPTLTATVPVTSTPLNTSTPEPTLTTPPTYVFPTLTPVQRLQYFRVKHDNQLAQYDYKSRTAAKDWNGINQFTPETVPLFVAPREGTGTNRTKLDKDWEKYLDALNDHDKGKIRYVKGEKTALFNSSGFPNLESLTMGGNLVTVVEVQGNMARVNTLDFNSPGSLKNVDYVTRPDLIHKFVVVGWDKGRKITYWFNPSQGDVYWPLVSNRPVWVPLERIEPFPHLPTVVTALKSQDIMKTPSLKGEKTGSKFEEGDYERIVEYYPSGSNVWARLVDGGWIALLKNWEYLTDWNMETLPPP